MNSKVKKIITTTSSCRRYGCFLKYREKPVIKNTVFIESKHGDDLAGNMFYLLKALTNHSKIKYTCYLVYSLEAKKRITDILEHYQMNDVILVPYNTPVYAKLIATSEFLVTDTSFPIWFSKREGQKILNTWHGTPLKKMGYEVPNQAYLMGNVQKNFQMADALLFPSEYMKEKMLDAYCLKETFKNRCYLAGYPRNAVFFDSERAFMVRNELSLTKKKIYAYMPTWRGMLGDTELSQAEDARRYFKELDEKLSEDELLYVKFHLYLNKKMDFTAYKHIRPFPEGYETYDFLNCADLLITDYSSVFFDFANTGKKVVLFTYDEESYVKERGWYVNLSELPFPKVTDCDSLLKELRTPKNYDDSAFLQNFCTYDNKDAVNLLVSDFFIGEDRLCKQRITGNGKKNVMIYCSNLAKNGITTSLLSFLSLCDKEKFNYFVFFRQGQLRNDKNRLEIIPKGIGLLPMSGSTVEWNIMDAIAHKLFFRCSVKLPWVRKKVEKMYRRAYHDRFSFCGIDEIIHFTGYTPDVTMLLSMADCHKMIFAHNDMYAEYQEKKNFHYGILNYAYGAFDKIIAVSESVKDSISKFGAYEDKIVVLNNPHDDLGVKEKAKEELVIDDTIQLSAPKEEFEAMLSSKKTKFITMGRFSEEKGHKRLIDAFDEFYVNHPETVLIILGGYGKLYEDTKEYAKSKKSASAIYLGIGFTNPFPVLARCDLFLLPSKREPLGLVLLEADSLSVPIAAVDIPGAGDFMKEHHGFIVPDSKEGLFMGMNAFLKGEVHPLNIDFSDYNKEIIHKFEALLAD